MRNLLFILAVSSAGCSPDPGTSPDMGPGGQDSGPNAPTDANLATDATSSSDVRADSSSTDAGDDPDAALDVSVSNDDGPTDMPSDGEFTLAGSLNGVDVTFERAYFGVTAAALTDSGMPELYVEAYAGGVAGCPEQNSPTPDQTMIITNMLLPDESTTADEDSGLVVSILDFAGDLPPISRAEGESLEFVDWNCTDCMQEGDAIVFDLDAPMMGGAFSGRVSATHCDSMDE